MTSLLPPAASAHAAGIDSVITLVHLLMAVLFAGWGAYFIYVLIRFRRSRQPAADHRGATGRLALGTEIGVVIAEAVLLVVFALPIWFSRTGAAPADARAVVVRIVAEQFAWNVHYPGADGQFGTTSPSLITPDNPLGLDRTSPFGADDVVDIGLLHLPVNRQAVLQLSSKDVIHSLGIPAMRIKQDVIPGSYASVWFEPTAIGTYDIACSQLCGLAHYRMRGVLTVESEADFARYLAENAPRR